MRVVVALLLLSGLAHAAPEGKTDAELLQDSEIICRYESTKRGEVDAGRLQHCMKMHRRFLDELIALDAKYDSDFYTQVARPYCYDKSVKRGVVDVIALQSCLDIEVDAYKDVVYFTEQLGEDKTRPVAMQALAKYGSWNMVRYIVKKELDPPP